MIRNLFVILLSLVLVGCVTQQTRFGKGTNIRDDAYLKSGAQIKIKKLIKEII
jgi:alanine dehydrogenase